MTDETIWIVTTDTTQSPDTQRSYREVAPEKEIKVSVSELEQKMSRFLQSLGRVFRQAEQEASHSPGIQLDEIELSVW